MKKKIFLLIYLINLLLVYSKTISQVNEWQVEILNNPSPGYLNFGWSKDSTYNLMDNYGNFIIPKNPPNKIVPFKLLNNGLWIAYSVKTFLLINEDFQIVDSIAFPRDYAIDIHDVLLLSNGHYLVLCMEKREMDLSQIVDGGKQNTNVVSAVLVETDRTGKVYWEWKALDHYNITDVTPDIDLTYSTIDFTHANSFTEDSDGNILVSMRFLDEITKIDKSTGNIIWRFGGKNCRNNEFRYLNDTINGFYGFSHQHSINILPNGNILLFDNGNYKPVEYSRAVEYEMDYTLKTAKKVWEYRNNPDYFVTSMGSARRLINGNTVISFGSLKYNTRVLEVKPDNTIAFKLNYLGDKLQSFFNATRYITKMNAVYKDINNNGNYIFNDSKFTTGVELKINNLQGKGFTAIEKHNYIPQNAKFSDSSFTSIINNRWVLSTQNISKINGIISFDLNTINDITKPKSIVVFARNKESEGIFKPLISNYNSDNNKISADFSNFGEFLLVSYHLDTPTIISPQNNQKDLATNIFFKWNKSNSVENYQLQISKSVNMKDLIIDTLITKNYLECEIYNLDYNTTYYWRIRGLNSKDTSNWSQINLFTTLDNNTLSTKLIKPINNSFGYNSNDSLIWYDIKNAKSYLLQISDDNEFISKSLKSIYLNNNFYIFKDYDNYKKYYWRVKVFYENDTSNWSPIWNFTSEINQPTLIYPENNSKNIIPNVTLKCQEVNGAEKYQLQLSKNYDFELLLIDTLSNKIEFQVKNLENNQNYYWKIRAINKLDTSSWTNIWTFKTIINSPKLCYPENSQKGVSLSDIIQWKSDLHNVYFDLQIANDINFENILLDTNFFDNYFDINKLDYNKKYFWRVKQGFDDEISNWSEIREFMTEIQIPELISPINNQNEVDINTYFEWSDLSYSNSYRINIADNIEFTNLLFDDIVQNSTSFYYNTKYNTDYFWRVRSELDDNFSKWSPIWKFTTKTETNVVDFNTADEYLYPNPANNFFILNYNNISFPTAIIYNLLGIEIQKFSLFINKDGNYRIDISNIPNGIYYLKIDNNYKKFIKY